MVKRAFDRRVGQVWEGRDSGTLVGSAAAAVAEGGGGMFRVCQETVSDKSASE